MVSLTEIPIINKKFQSIINGNSRTRINNTNEAIFDYDNILEVIDTLNNANYSFQFRYKDTPISEFYNLVIGKTAAGETTEPFVLKYICDESQIDQFVNSDFNFSNFKGSVSLHKYTDYFQEGQFSKIAGETCPPDVDEFGDPIPCETQPIDGSGGGGGSTTGNGTGNPSGGTGTIVETCINIVIEYTCSCMGHTFGENCTCASQGGTGP